MINLFLVFLVIAIAAVLKKLVDIHQELRDQKFTINKIFEKIDTIERKK